MKDTIYASHRRRKIIRRICQIIVTLCFHLLDSANITMAFLAVVSQDSLLIFVLDLGNRLSNVPQIRKTSLIKTYGKIVGFQGIINIRNIHGCAMRCRLTQLLKR